MHSGLAEPRQEGLDVCFCLAGAEPGKTNEEINNTRQPRPGGHHLDQRNHANRDSPASATYLKNGKRQESSSSISFHRNDQIIWSLDFITPGKYWITLSIRTGNARPTDMMAGYHLKLNGRELPLTDSLIPISLGAFASDASWKDWRGSIRTKIPVQLKPGDKLKLTTDLDWSVTGQLSLEMLTRIEETRRRDAEHKFGISRAHEVILDLEKY